MIEIVADSNALMAPFKQKFNIDTELRRLFGIYEIIVPWPVVGELERLGETKTHARAGARLAKTRKVMPTKSSGDDSVLELAAKRKALIMTNDKELISRARKEGIGIVYVKKGGRLGLDKDWTA